MSDRKSFWSALNGFFSGASAAAKTPSQPVVPPVDPDVPVTNPRFVSAIRKHQIGPTNETAAELIGELKESVLLVAIILDKPLAKVSEGQVLFKKGDTFAVVTVTDDSDNRLLALFTDHPELQRFTNQANSTLVMPAEEAMTFVLEKGYAGLVVNPASDATLTVGCAIYSQHSRGQMMRDIPLNIGKFVRSARRTVSNLQLEGHSLRLGCGADL
ncbi:MAG: SseB family protein [Pyrinomonadaceae bacterium]